MQSGHLEALERRIRSEPKRFRRSEVAVDDHPEKNRSSSVLDCWSGVVLLHIMLYVGAKIAAEQRGRHFGATAAERCQQASLRIQGWLRFRRLKCQHGELLCSTVALYSCDSCAAFVLWRLQVKLTFTGGPGA